MSTRIEWPQGALNRERTLEILREHNAWRRGALGPQTDPRVLGLALDAAIEALASATEPPSGGEAWPASVRDEALEVLRNVDAQLGATGQASARVERLINLIAGIPDASAPPSAPVGVETVDAAAWIEVLALPEGFRVAEHLPGIWEYQFDIEDEADEDSDRKVSGASWNHPALAAIAAWGHAYDAVSQQPAADDVDALQFRKRWQAGFAEGRRDQQPAAMECPHRARCDCLAACKYGFAGDGMARPGGAHG